MSKTDIYAIPTALVVLTDKYGNEHWFAGVAAYGDNRVILYYRDTKNVPQGSGRFRRFAGVEVTWKKVA
jgi:hypothetical protein